MGCAVRGCPAALTLPAAFAAAEPAARPRLPGTAPGSSSSGCSARSRTSAAPACSRRASRRPWDSRGRPSRTSRTGCTSRRRCAAWERRRCARNCFPCRENTAWTGARFTSNARSRKLSSGSPSISISLSFQVPDPASIPSVIVGTNSGLMSIILQTVASRAMGSVENSRTFIGRAAAAPWPVAFHGDDAVHDIQPRLEQSVEVHQHAGKIDGAGELDVELALERAGNAAELVLHAARHALEAVGLQLRQADDAVGSQGRRWRRRTSCSAFPRRKPSPFPA